MAIQKTSQPLDKVPAEVRNEQGVSLLIVLIDTSLCNSATPVRGAFVRQNGRDVRNMSGIEARTNNAA